MLSSRLFPYMQLFYETWVPSSFVSGRVRRFWFFSPFFSRNTGSLHTVSLVRLDFYSRSTIFGNFMMQRTARQNQRRDGMGDLKSGLDVTRKVHGTPGIEGWNPREKLFPLSRLPFYWTTTHLEGILITIQPWKYLRQWKIATVRFHATTFVDGRYISVRQDDRAHCCTTLHTYMYIECSQSFLFSYDFSLVLYSALWQQFSGKFKDRSLKIIQDHEHPVE